MTATAKGSLRLQLCHR